MKSKSINACAEALAKEISERRIYNLEEIKILIAVRFNDALIDFVKEHISQNEKEYFDLLQQQAKNKIGSPQYLSMGYKLAAAKHKKTTSNRILNEVRQDDMFVLLRKFVVAKYGQEVFDEFISKAKNENMFPVTSSTF